MRKPKYQNRGIDEKPLNELYHPANESRDAYGNFKRQYRPKVDGELSIPARSRTPQYEHPHSEYREQTPKERKTESQTSESEPPTSKLNDEMSELRDEIGKTRQDSRELREAIREDSRAIDKKMVELGIEKEIQKNIADFLDTNHEPESLRDTRERFGLESDTEAHNETVDTPAKETEKAEPEFIESELLEDVILRDPSELSGEEGIVREMELWRREMELEEPQAENKIETSRIDQPREVLDRLEQEMNYLKDNLSNNPTHQESLPELMGDLFGAEHRMNEVMDSIERAEPVKTLPYEESEEF